ncbi:DUF2254 domain-containing protein [Blastococcus mobilis]|uniref:Uncharacterized membrane protein n=1 Tax=Blastococcus mobilis TaxID=1938746 RepID=A0A238YE12_9ACTN|nr:DUF2254 domain-containing protein [Blastococcus mobilis]SNR69516.1 Uncharacterized membrane protein [Blastococcus mobilis]
MSARPEPLLRLRLAAAVYRFRESLFLLPALIVVGGVLLAELGHAVDRAIGADRAVPGTLAMSSNTATWLLSTVAGAMITTAGVVFSLTVVSLQLASSQFSPRVMRSFVRDRLSQVVIGLLIATFVYCVLTLRYISADPDSPAPRITLTVAVGLAVATVLLIVAHLDHLARGLQVGYVVRAIAAEGREVIEHRQHAGHSPRASAEEPRHEGADTLTVPAPRDGWVTQAPGDRMLAAVPPRTTVRLETRIGAYIHEGEPLVTVWPVPADTRGVLRRLSATVTVADTRTMQHDVDFAIRQLVDIGLRALSAAINDPTTAVEVTLRIGGLLRRLLVCDLPPVVMGGPEGRALVRPWDLSHEDYIAHGFDQLRQASVTQPHVVTALLRVLRMLITLVQEADRPEHVPALRRQMQLLLAAVEQQPGLHPEDLDRLRAVASGDDPADRSRPRQHSRWNPSAGRHGIGPGDAASRAASPASSSPSE